MSEVQCEGNVGYSDVCLRYRLREILGTVMSLRYRVRKCYVQGCVFEVQDEGNIGYSDVSEVEGEGNVVYSDVCRGTG